MTSTLSDCISRMEAANAAYRVGSPTMSDAAYDALENEVREAAANPVFPQKAREKARAFLKKVGGAPPPTSGWRKVAHATPMGSLSKAQNAMDFALWSRGVLGPYVAMDKMDGIAISLTYEKGVLKRAVTRGDGVQGEDITRNVRRMGGVVNDVGDSTLYGEVRGEIILAKPKFELHFKGDSNPRNSAAGTAKRQSDSTKCQYLDVYAFEWVPASGMIESKTDELVALSTMGFSVPVWWTCSDRAACEKVFKQYVDNDRDKLPYVIDGVVFRPDSNIAWAKHGSSDNRPKGSIAWKFEHDAKPTVLNDIVWQVGASGRITPVAQFDVVDLAGANVRQASLHNLDYIASLSGGKDLARGAQILVSRRNDVIPYVEELLVQGKGGNIALPLKCPACGGPTHMDGAYLVCPNTVSCSAQVVGSIKRWVRKVGILGLGESTIEGLVAAGVISDLADLYTLDPKQVEGVCLDGRRIGSRAKIFLKDLEAKRVMPLERLLGSLGIPLMGRSMCRRLIEAGYTDLNALAFVSAEDLTGLPDMGTAKAEAFVAGFRTRIPLIKKLLRNGVQYTVDRADSKAATASGGLSGVVACFTGVRDKGLEAGIAAKGGVVKSSYSSKITHLVCKDPNSGSSKLKKARTAGKMIVTLDEMRALVAAA